MPDLVLVTKVSLSRLRHNIVPRKKLLRQLHQGIQEGHLLTLASAPAGYGKTTTIRRRLEETGYAVAWIMLEKSDHNLKQFLTYRLTAQQQAGYALGQAALDVVENSQD